MGYAGLARDDKGVVLRAFAGWKCGRSNALEAEGCAILKAIKIADSLRWDKVVFELDSVSVIANILSGVSDEHSSMSWSSSCSALFTLGGKRTLELMS
ncbi:hypothetical protein QQ045_011403 [Rhodiola kirilowii]